jgi:hypothetical protein
MDAADKAKVTRIRWAIAGVMLAAFAAIALWSVLFNPAAQDDASDAHYACVDKILTDTRADITFPGPGDVSYAGSDGQWTITGEWTQFGELIPYTCRASRVSEGLYRVTWE